MTVRALALPRDLPPLAAAMDRAFQYPEHPEWNAQADDLEQRAETIRRLRRLWPAVRALHVVAPVTRDLLRGAVWDDKGALVAFAVAQRDGKTAAWEIGPVGVLPEYRRRGIARSLMVAALEDVGRRGGKIVRLGVIDGNTPAVELYRSLGFDEYGGTVQLSRAPGPSVARPCLPAGYVESPLPASDWRTRLDMDRRLDPPLVREYQPLDRRTYRPPFLVRALTRLFSGSRDADVVVRQEKDGVAVATVGWSVSKNERGLCFIRAALDPAHPVLAEVLVRRALAEVTRQRPTLRTVLFLPTWATTLAEEAQALGFTPVKTFRAMGKKLS